MKTKQKDFDDDFIGGQESLTIEEELALSKYFAQKKIESKRSTGIIHRRTVKHERITV
jgi:hypothetical protein